MNDADPGLTWIPPTLDHVPSELKALNRWVLWKVEARDGKPTKVLYDPRTLRNAASNNPQTWSGVEFAYQQFTKPIGFAGIGFVFNGDGLIGIDFDHVRDKATGEIDPVAWSEIVSLGSYTEVSPSGTGLHTLCKGTIPGGLGRKKASREIYGSGRYFTVTGRVPPKAPNKLAGNQEVINELFHRWFPAKEAPQKAPVITPSHTAGHSDDEVIRKATSASNGAKFTALMRGDISGYPSASEADAALCGILAFWTQDQTQIANIVRSSGLWDTKWDRVDYQDRTIGGACSLVGETYEWPGVRDTTDTLTRPEDLPAIPRVNLELRCTLPSGHFIGDYVEYWGTRTDAYPELHHLSAVALISIAIDRKVICPLSFATIYPNMWVFALGQSGVARKSTALSKMRYLAGAEFPEKALPGSFSPEALIEKLSECPRSYLIKDEAAGILQGINKKSYLADLRDFLSEMFECETPPPRCLRTSQRKVKTEFRIPEPYLTFAWATTPESFKEAVTPLDVKSGFLARFLYYYPRYEKDTFGVSLATSVMNTGLAVMGNRYDTIITALGNFHEIVAIPSDYCLDLYNAWYITKQKEITRRYSVEDSVFSRMSTAVFKLAMIYYVGSAEFIDDVKAHISTTRPYNAPKRPGDQQELITARFTIPDVYFEEAIRNVREYFLPVAASIVSEIDGMASGNVQKQILQFLRDEGGRATKSAILRKMRLKAKDLTDHLDTLEESESIRSDLLEGKDGKKTLFFTLQGGEL
ncbi:MAG: DUF3987 domain-containing protein [Methanomicrobiales archaeon]|nr:DUF3987 domain-containing protein [Methanomicrobiales archaeon]